MVTPDMARLGFAHSSGAAERGITFKDIQS